MKKIIKSILCYLRSILVLFGIDWNCELFRKDLNRWKKIYKLEISDWRALSILLWEKPEFRNLLIYRNRNRLVYRAIIKLFYPPMNTLYIETDKIGGGLFIQHGFSTMISAKEIGENCWINQQVTIGYKGNNNPPVIGNNVIITCGAKVLGDIIVADNAVIGANAVVVKNVEKGAIMGGIPAKKIK